MEGASAAASSRGGGGSRGSSSRSTALMRSGPIASLFTSPDRPRRQRWQIRRDLDPGTSVFGAVLDRPWLVLAASLRYRAAKFRPTANLESGAGAPKDMS